MAQSEMIQQQQEQLLETIKATLLRLWVLIQEMEQFTLPRQRDFRWEFNQKSKTISNIHIEGDNLLVINAIKGLWQPPWQIVHIIEDIRILLNSFSAHTIRHVYREGNKAADLIANVGHLVQNSFFLTNCNNSKYHDILVNDSFEIPLVRRVS